MGSDQPPPEQIRDDILNDVDGVLEDNDRINWVLYMVDCLIDRINQDKSPMTCSHNWERFYVRPSEALLSDYPDLISITQVEFMWCKECGAFRHRKDKRGRWITERPECQRRSL